MMAQLVEQRIRNAWVAGSSPARGSFLLCEISTSVVHRLPKPGGGFDSVSRSKNKVLEIRLL